MRYKLSFSFSCFVPDVSVIPPTRMDIPREEEPFSNLIRRGMLPTQYGNYRHSCTMHKDYAFFFLTPVLSPC